MGWSPESTWNWQCSRAPMNSIWKWMVENFIHLNHVNDLFYEIIESSCSWFLIQSSQIALFQNISNGCNSKVWAWTVGGAFTKPRIGRVLCRGISIQMALLQENGWEGWWNIMKYYSLAKYMIVDGLYQKHHIPYGKFGKHRSGRRA